MVLNLMGHYIFPGSSDETMGGQHLRKKVPQLKNPKPVLEQSERSEVCFQENEKHYFKLSDIQ